MTNNTNSTSGLPLYHDGMLMIRLRPSMARFAPTVAMTEAIPETPGLAAMAALEKRGMVKQVTPLFRQKQTPAQPAVAPMGVTATLGAAAIDSPKDAVSARTCMVELENDADATSLQSSMAADPDIEYAARVPVRYLVARKNGTTKSSGAMPTAAAPPDSEMWNLHRIRLNAARSSEGFKDANAIKVAVLDTGIDANHPDLAGQFSKYIYSYPELNAPSGPQDLIGHGTHVAGTIGASMRNEFGVRGICNSKMMIWKIFDDEPDLVRVLFGPDEYVYYVNPAMYLRALEDCLEQGVDVINLSIGGEGQPDFHERKLYDRLLARGTTIVAAMGNERRRGSPTSFPAAIPGVIAVGATNVNDRVAGFSNGGPHISVSAPGVGIWSTLPTYPGQSGFDAIIRPDGSTVPGAPRPRDTDYFAWQGTSMASPHVAAAAALLLAKDPTLNSREVRDRLMQSADQVSDMQGAQFHVDYGAGRLNLQRLLEQAT